MRDSWGAYLAGAAEDADQRRSRAVGQHEVHLDEHLELALDGALVAVGEGLGAVAACDR